MAVGLQWKTDFAPILFIEGLILFNLVIFSNMKGKNINRM